MKCTPLLRFTTVTGYFRQDDPATDPDAFDYVESNFGLIEKHYDEHLGVEQTDSQWRRFDAHIRRLNDSETKKLKVLFLGRHGEGVHNVAERKYGTKQWDDYWSLQDGDEDGNWVDAHLTEQGRCQAQVAHAAWEKQIEAGIPSPESYYVSPLNRCLETAHITFQGLPIPHTDPFKPTIKELLRETMGQHTCDRRSAASEIAEEYPEYLFGAGFSEEDKLWDPKVRESSEHRNDRLRCLLNDIFVHDETFWKLWAIAAFPWQLVQ
ncbi:hypothetical protein PENVUL_c006G07864 [Penicillium vulpinum]|uniref:Phosphoglycerate mutase n=1 Tax=Penicillium vulpinum TaxID=29845 RepID=A0A1V6S6M1_9EURO|nr:hypothetical protein PENVUL_c006G07864 [Penicillium vulpinum]